MKKRVLSILLCICMAASLLPTAALAADGPAYSNNFSEIRPWLGLDAATVEGFIGCTYWRPNENGGISSDHTLYTNSVAENVYQEYISFRIPESSEARSLYMKVANVKGSTSALRITTTQKNWKAYLGDSTYDTINPIYAASDGTFNYLLEPNTTYYAALSFSFRNDPDLINTISSFAVQPLKASNITYTTDGNGKLVDSKASTANKVLLDSISAGSTAYGAATTTAVDAIPNADYKFSHWSVDSQEVEGGSTGFQYTNNVYNITDGYGVNVKANFVKDSGYTYVLSAGSPKKVGISWNEKPVISSTRYGSTTKDYWYSYNNSSNTIGVKSSGVNIDENAGVLTGSFYLDEPCYVTIDSATVYTALTNARFQIDGQSMTPYDGKKIGNLPTAVSPYTYNYGSYYAYLAAGYHTITITARFSSYYSYTQSIYASSLNFTAATQEPIPAVTFSKVDDTNKEFTDATLTVTKDGGNLAHGATVGIGATVTATVSNIQNSAILLHFDVNGEIVKGSSTVTRKVGPEGLTIRAVFADKLSDNNPHAKVTKYLTCSEDPYKSGVLGSSYTDIGSGNPLLWSGVNPSGSVESGQTGITNATLVSDFTVTQWDAMMDFEYSGYNSDAKVTIYQVASDGTRSVVKTERIDRSQRFFATQFYNSQAEFNADTSGRKFAFAITSSDSITVKNLKIGGPLNSTLTVSARIDTSTGAGATDDTLAQKITGYTNNIAMVFDTTTVTAPRTIANYNGKSLLFDHWERTDYHYVTSTDPTINYTATQPGDATLTAVYVVANEYNNINTFFNKEGNEQKVTFLADTLKAGFTSGDNGNTLWHNGGGEELVGDMDLYSQWFSDGGFTVEMDLTFNRKEDPSNSPWLYFVYLEDSSGNAGEIAYASVDGKCSLYIPSGQSFRLKLRILSMQVVENIQWNAITSFQPAVYYIEDITAYANNIIDPVTGDYISYKAIKEYDGEDNIAYGYLAQSENDISKMTLKSPDGRTTLTIEQTKTFMENHEIPYKGLISSYTSVDGKAGENKLVYLFMKDYITKDNRYIVRYDPETEYVSNFTITPKLITAAYGATMNSYNYAYNGSDNSAFVMPDQTIRTNMLEGLIEGDEVTLSIKNFKADTAGNYDGSILDMYTKEYKSNGYPVEYYSQWEYDPGFATPPLLPGTTLTDGNCGYYANLDSAVLEIGGKQGGNYTIKILPEHTYEPEQLTNIWFAQPVYRTKKAITMDDVLIYTADNTINNTVGLDRCIPSGGEAKTYDGISTIYEGEYWKELHGSGYDWRSYWRLPMKKLTWMDDSFIRLVDTYIYIERMDLCTKDGTLTDFATADNEGYYYCKVAFDTSNSNYYFEGYATGTPTIVVKTKDTLIKPREIGAGDVKALVETKDYDSSNIFEDSTLHLLVDSQSITLTGVTAEVSSANAGTYTSATVTGLVFPEGANTTGKYTLPESLKVTNAVLTIDGEDISGYVAELGNPYEKITFDGTEKTPGVVVYELDFDADLPIENYLTPDDDYTVTYHNNINAADANGETGPYAEITGKGQYSGTLSVPFTIAKSDSQSETTVTVSTVTYGGNVVLTAAVSRPTVSSLARTVASNTVAFYTNDADDEPTLLGTANVTYTNTTNPDAGTATLTYNTTDKKLAIGANTVWAVYGGGVNLNGSESDTITVTIEQKALSATVNTSDSSATREYDGTTEFTDVALTLTTETNDDVSATANGTAASKDVGEALTFAPKAVSALTGADMQWYTLAVEDVSGNVRITPKDVSNSLTEAFSYTVAEGKVSFTEPTFTDEAMQETINGSFDYAYNEIDVGDYSALVATLNELDANETPYTVVFNFTASGNYTGTISGTLAFGIAALTFGTEGAVTVSETPTYGDTWGKILTINQTKLSATIGEESIAGKFALMVNGKDYNGSAIPAAGNHEYEIVFTSTDGTFHNVVVVSNTVIVAKRVAKLAWSNTTQTYTGKELMPTVTIANRVGNDTVSAGMAVSPVEPINEGEYTFTVMILIGPASINYVLPEEDLSQSFTITPANAAGFVAVYLGTDANNNGLLDEGDTLNTDISGVTPTMAQRVGIVYQWFNGDDAIQDATDSSYVLQDTDTEGSIYCVVTFAKNIIGKITSNRLAIAQKALTGPIEITGTLTVGETLTVSEPTNTEIPDDAYTVAWYRDNVLIPGEIGLTHVVTKEDQGKWLKVVITAVEGSGYTGTLTATTSGKIPAAMPDQPVITASAGDGRVTLRWVKPFDGGSAITGYSLQVSDSMSAQVGGDILLDRDATSYTVTGLKNGETYSFTLSVHTENGDAVSETVTAAPSAPVPSGGGTVSKQYTILEGENGRFDGENGLSFRSEGAYKLFSSAAVNGKKLGSGDFSTAAGSTILTLKPEYLSTLAAGKYELKMTFTDGYSKATFIIDEKIENPFNDVAADAYYYDAVLWAVSKGITSGTTAATFSPDTTCTRAQTVTFLWRAMGSPEPTTTANPFTDVSVDDYYYKAVLWAVSKGITSGTTATTFGPNAVCSRAQVATFLWRAEGSPLVNFAMNFTDIPADSYYAEAVRWAVSEGITSGTGAATFSPAADCTRAQIVTLLFRQLEK